METVALKLLEYSPVVAILAFGAWMFWKEIKAKDLRISEVIEEKDQEIRLLNKEVRDLLVENMRVIASLKDVIEEEGKSTSKILEEIVEIKRKVEWLTGKISTEPRN